MALLVIVVLSIKYYVYHHLAPADINNVFSMKRRICDASDAFT